MSILNRIQRILSAEINSRTTGWTASNVGELYNADLDPDQALRDEIDKAMAEASVRSAEAESTHITQAREVLGVSVAYSITELKSAWKSALLKCHPDQFVGATPAEQNQATEQTKKINAAYILLRSQL